MFGISEKSTLAQRLGRANTKRRQILAYHQDHSDQISKYVDVVLEKAKLAPSNGPKSISTKWTQNTTASTILQNQQVGSDSGRTKFSVTTSTANDQPAASIPPPPKQRGNSAENEPFFCPYCHQTIQLENLEEDWRYHVLDDLRPYICTFGDCVKADQLYDSYTEWSTSASSIVKIYHVIFVPTLVEVQMIFVLICKLSTPMPSLKTSSRLLSSSPGNLALPHNSVPFVPNVQ